MGQVEHGGQSMIKVEKTSATKFKITVQHAVTTVHTVSVDPAYHQKLTSGRVSVETLLEKSFEFLLERESNTAILRSFDLPVVGHYFPEYETTIRNELA
ncbi:MAG: hypothetical protein ACREUA_01530 [Burkholderiales bacterium]